MKKVVVLLSLLVVAMFLIGCAPKESTDGTLAGEAVKKSAINKPVAKGCDADMQFKIIPNKETVHSSLCYNGEWLKCGNPLVYKGKKYGVWGEEKPGVKTYGPYDGTESFKTGADYFCIPTGWHFIICDTGNWWDTSDIDDYKVLVAENGIGWSCDKRTNTFVLGKGLSSGLLNLPKQKTIKISSDEEENPTIKDICK